MRYNSPAWIALAASTCLVACGGTEGPDPSRSAVDDGDLEAEARRIASEVLIVDTHVDVPYRLAEKMEDISHRTAEGHFDYPRARAGGLNAPFMSIYVPARLQETGGAKQHADKLIDMVQKFATDWPDKFAVARFPEEVRRIVEQGLIALPMGMENGAPLEGDLANLTHFYERGVRYITLTHSQNNAICDSSYATERTWNGLSPFGKEVVAEMNRLGMMIDVSHVSDDAFYQVLELSQAPVIASHSSCRKFTPDWERNMDDEMIRLLASQGGVIQINFGSAFLREDAYRQSMEFWESWDEHLRANQLEAADEHMQTFRAEYWKDRERIYGDLSDVVAHIDHVVGLVGVDHVGFGSDFDGVSALPAGLKDVSHYPDLIRALLERGYSRVEIEKIAAGNVMRVWSEVERVARELQTAERR